MTTMKRILKAFGYTILIFVDELKKGEALLAQQSREETAVIGTRIPLY